jgi:alkylhydroperoxidase family enzyme
MLRRLIHRLISSRIEKPFGYDASYMHRLADADMAAFFKFSVVSGLVSQGAVPAEAAAAAALVGTLTEDCGPCVQISVDLALKRGADPRALRAVLAGDESAMGSDAALGYRFARATLAKDLKQADACREEIVRRWGEKGLAALSLSLVASRMYPTLKYAMGYGRACSTIEVAGAPAPFARPAPVAA